MRQLIGCDFTSSPRRGKPITLAIGTLAGKRVVLQQLRRIETLDAFAAWLAEPGCWTAAFDFPFGLPRELVEQLGWPTGWRDCMAHFAALDRAEIRRRFAAFCDARPVGGKFAHRATDGPSGSSPSMKWVNPPVAYMLHAGVPRLLAAGVHLPGLHEGASGDVAPDGRHRRIALEGYPGMLAREVLGRRSYKADDKARQTADRLIARKDLLMALEHGHGPQGPLRLGLRLKLTPAQHDALVADPSADLLDAVLCMVQAAWAELQGPPLYGLPPGMDALEGWTVSA